MTSTGSLLRFGPGTPGRIVGFWIPVGTLIAAEAVSALRPPTFDTPLFHFPFLALIHALALGVVLPYLAFVPIMKNGTGRIGAALCLSGGLTLVLGFLFVPRSLVPAQAGLMSTLGFLLVLNRYRPLWGARAYPVFTALVLTGLTGTLLGVTLARKTIDPIPFDGIEIHVLLGLAFTLTVLLRMRSSSPDRSGRNPFHLLFGLSLVLLFSIELPVPNGIMAAASLGLLIVALKGMDVSGPTRPFWILGLAFAAVLSPIWNFGAGPMLSMFVLVWVYALVQTMFSNMGEWATGALGSVSFLAGLYAGISWMSAAGVLIHVYAIGKGAYSDGIKRMGAASGDQERVTDGSSSTPSSQTSTS
jgi:hypothetical protein